MKSGIPLPAQRPQNAHAAMSAGVPRTAQQAPRRAPPPPPAKAAAAGKRPRLRQPIPSRPSLLIEVADERSRAAAELSHQAPVKEAPIKVAVPGGPLAPAKPVYDEADNFWHIEAEKDEEDLDRDTVFDITGGAWEPAGAKIRRYAQRLFGLGRR